MVLLIDSPLNFQGNYRVLSSFQRKLGHLSLAQWEEKNHPYNCYSIQIHWGQRVSRVGELLALHMASQGLIPQIIYVPPSTS